MSQLLAAGFLLSVSLMSLGKPDETILGEMKRANESIERWDVAAAEQISERVLKLAVKGMLPKGPLGYAMLKKMKVYAGASHPHSAQQPQELKI